MLTVHRRFGIRLVSSVGLLLATSLVAQEPEAGPIQDNSFLIEEAYNQPAGVVQHINTFSLDRRGDAWSYSFTQEWPFLSQRHQLSYSVPLHNVSATGTGVGDVGLNYRYQLPLDSRPDLAVAPRVSLLLPSGSVPKNRGTGGAGLQLNLPVSATLSRSLVAHFNAGATYTPSAENAAGDVAATRGFNLGQSVIWLITPTLNFMAELAWTRTPEILDGGEIRGAESLLLAPGFRGAINLSRGLQIVPGLAVPIGIGPSRGERTVFFYLSFEHPFASSGR